MRKCVVPHAGTGIEIFAMFWMICVPTVVPHAGTWIEILFAFFVAVALSVVPHAGTWIEIQKVLSLHLPVYRRSPRGNVD